MDTYREMTQGAGAGRLKTIEMHTVGEPTRIVVEGYPQLEGRTLLEKRECAKARYDHVRKLLMSEPRGHYDMYGAILVQDTEMTVRGEADIGVLFCHNDGYSTMCGHATIALGRFLVDTEDRILFPNREALPYDSEKQTVELRLHAPCGLVLVTVPVMPRTSSSASSVAITGPPPPPLSSVRLVSDPRRMVSFLSVPSFAVVKNLRVSIPSTSAWSELHRREKSTSRDEDSQLDAYEVLLDVAFGGAFYAIVEAAQLGFEGDHHGRVHYDKESIKALEFAAQKLKALLEPQMDGVLKPFRNVVEKDLQFLYGVTVVDAHEKVTRNGATVRADRNLCFFADSQLDRSPTGSCVSARTALAAAKGVMNPGETWEYHSIVSQPGVHREESSERFIGTLTDTQVPILLGEGDEPEKCLGMSYVVQVEGFAWYTGGSTFILEDGDTIGKGFLVGK